MMMMTNIVSAGMELIAQLLSAIFDGGYGALGRSSATAASLDPWDIPVRRVAARARTVGEGTAARRSAPPS